MSAARYRYAVFLTEDDWTSAVRGWGKRVERFSAAARRAQVERIRYAIYEAEGDCIPDGDEVRHALYLTEADYNAFMEGATHPKYGAPSDPARRILGELLTAAGDATPL
ncbi:hypothetical protein AB5J55_22330 [Streptomyces sp. R11]|uniref:Uncharacterized protein n=1 Tax=Streptomyces sp. R11 TaxID=3238625 RepID=A0AB39N1T9_9ACTN